MSALQQGLEMNSAFYRKQSFLNTTRLLAVACRGTIVLAACQETGAEPDPLINVQQIEPTANPVPIPGPETLNGGTGQPNGPTGEPEPVTPQPEPVEPQPPVSQAMSKHDAARLLVQASFGPTQASTSELTEIGRAAWIAREMEKAPTLLLDDYLAKKASGQDLSGYGPNREFWNVMIEGDDQLRQRTVLALSQIIVASNAPGGSVGGAESFLHYFDILSRNAFGNYRDLLEEITYSPAMANYLTYIRNKKANPRTGNVPDENYAREIMQLFTIGLVELNQDGTEKPGPIETYTNEDIQGLAKVFTGLSFAGGFSGQNRPDQNHIPLEMYQQHHSPEEKSFLGLTIPANTDGRQSIEMALDHLFNHPNVAPFVSKRLIQRFVTSNPSSGYVNRVANAFDRGSFAMPNGVTVGEGRRGDLAATVAAILLDSEAVSPNGANSGKVREPILRFTHWARAFNVSNPDAALQPLLTSAHRTNRLNQTAFRAPSVFNFYRPGFVAPGTESAERNMVTPELQLVNETSVVGYINFMSRFVRDQTPLRAGMRVDAFRPDYASELALADDAAALLESLNTKLLYGRMRPESRDRIERIINEVQIRAGFEEEDRQTRVELAVILILTTPEYSVQR